MYNFDKTMMRVWSEKRETIKSYDKMAEVYDIQYVDEQYEKYRIAIKSISLNLDDVVLDVGCGTGLLMEKLAPSVEEIVGVDSSINMLKRAGKRTDPFGNASLVCGDADNLPFRDNAFSKVFAFTLIQNTPNPIATLQEIKRVVESRALIVVTFLKKDFTEERLKKMLKESGVLLIDIKDNEKLKDYVAICSNKEAYFISI